MSKPTSDPKREMLPAESPFASMTKPQRFAYWRQQNRQGQQRLPLTEQSADRVETEERVPA